MHMHAMGHGAPRGRGGAWNLKSEICTGNIQPGTAAGGTVPACKQALSRLCAACRCWLLDELVASSVCRMLGSSTLPATCAYDRGTGSIVEQWFNGARQTIHAFRLNCVDMHGQWSSCPGCVQALNLSRADCVRPLVVGTAACDAAEILSTDALCAC